MTTLSGTNIPAPVMPFTEEDSYPTHDAKYGRGGWRTVATLAEMQAIPAGRRTRGMQIRVTDDPTSTNNVLWEWDGAAFVISDFSQVQANSVYNCAQITAGATLTLDVSTISLFEVTLMQASTAISLTGGPSAAGLAKQVTLKLIQGTGVNQVTWGEDVVWAGGVAPQLSYDAGYCDLVTLVRFGQNKWIGAYAGGWFEDAGI